MTTRTFGIEIEAYGVAQGMVADALRRAGIPCYCQGYNHHTSQTWKIVSDGSLHGLRNAFELVSPVLTGDAGIATVRTVCQILTRLGAKVNRQCGLHVHFGVRDIDIKGLRNVVAAYVRSESLIDSLVAPSRRGNAAGYCKSMIGMNETVEQAFERLARPATMDDLQRRMNSYDRYHKVNLTAFNRHGTVEFRQHHGTVDGDKIANWVLFLDALIADAIAAPTMKPWRVTDQSKLKLATLLRRIGVTPYTRKYLLARAAELKVAA